MSSTQEVGDIFGAGKGPAQAMLRSPTVLITSIGLWGMDLFFYKLFNIDYKYVLQFDLVEMEQEERETNNRKKKKKRRRKKDQDASSGGASLSTTVSPSSALELADISKRKSSAAGNSNPSPSSVESTDVHAMSLLLHLEEDHHGLEDGMTFKDSGSMDTNDTPPPSSHANSAALELQQLQQQFNPSSDHYGMSITWFKLVVFSVVLLFLLHFTTHFWMDHLGRSSIGAVFSFYASILLYIFLPLQSNGWLRRSFVLILQRSFELINPRCSCIFLDAGDIPRKIPFVDVFYADAMCSLSKVFFDWGMLLHQASHFPDPVPAAAHNIVLPSLCAAVPYVIRARQCLIMHTVGVKTNDPKRYQHLMNAFKYSTSIFPLVLSAYQKTLPNPQDASRYEGLLIGLLVINASYSLYWDIVMDWGMMQDPYKVAQTVVGCKPTNSNHYMPAAGMDKDVMMLENGKDASDNGIVMLDEAVAPTLPLQSMPSTPSGKGHDIEPHMVYHASQAQNAFHHVCLRPRLRFGFVLSALIVVADSILRFSWMLRFVAKFPSNDAFALCTQFLEVFRRAIWNLLRVEWENIKIQQKTKGTGASKGGGGDNEEIKPLIMSHRRSKSRDSWSDGSSNTNTRMLDAHPTLHPTLRKTGAIVGGGGSLEMKSVR
jgi:hypothetical protein